MYSRAVFTIVHRKSRIVSLICLGSWQPLLQTSVSSFMQARNSSSFRLMTARFSRTFISDG